MPDYFVSWEIDITADSPRAAAEQAREHQMRPDTTAVVFRVWDQAGEEELVDLLEEENMQEVPGYTNDTERP